MSPRVTPKHRIPDIIRAAADVFGQKGYRLAQMEEIARAAGVSKATLYYYFKSKMHLFYYLLENGIPADGESAPAPGDFSLRSEDEFLGLVKERLKRRSKLASIADILESDSSGGPEGIDPAHEVERILGEMWDLFESNRVQIVILENSAFEFPELARVYDRYARQQVLSQLERYLEHRTRAGAIRPLKSIAMTARLIVESLAMFAWKLSGDYFSNVRFPKSEALPELVAMFANGLRK
jgi:AcrR family transcriptional regulator